MRADFSDGEAGFADDVDLMIAARYRLPMLISAASTTTVRRIARRVHDACFGRARPFVELAVASLPPSRARFAARWQQQTRKATGGSLLLAGIEATPLDIQDALAECLMFNERVEPARRLRPIAGTTVRLFERVIDGQFSAPLFYRLNVIHLVIDDDLPLT